jgi:hypothetical protein
MAHTSSSGEGYSQSRHAGNIGPAKEQHLVLEPGPVCTDAANSCVMGPTGGRVGAERQAEAEPARQVSDQGLAMVSSTHRSA